MSSKLRILGLLCVVAAAIGGYKYTQDEKGSPAKANVEATDAKKEGSWFDGLFKDEPKSSQSQGEEIGDFSQFHKSIGNLQVPCGYIISTSQLKSDRKLLDSANVKPLSTLLDPTLKFSSISKAVVDKDIYLRVLYEEGGDSKVIPAGALYLRMGSFDATVPSPELKVVKEDRRTPSTNDFHLRLGSDFMRSTRATIDLEEMELYVTVDGEPVMVPFLQKRESPFSTTDDEL